MKATITHLCHLWLLSGVAAFSVERQHLIGVWKLEVFPTTSLQKKSGITIKLQDDGSFTQFDEHDDGDFLHGCWDFDEDSQLQLAIGRSDCRADTLLSGKVLGGDRTTIAKGQVSAGKFMYPPSHMAFFDQVMAAADVVGKFSLKQVMAFNKIMVPEEGEKVKEENVFKTEDFFGQEFVMTVVPIECNVKPQEVWDKEKREWNSPLDDQAADIRSLPITFYANSTFQAIGVNKILRGRFEVTEDDKLWFAVSRFGMGRSTPGSVYSEGGGLSHEDERTYLGAIERTPNGSFRVEGKVTFGADLGQDARPEPVGTFIFHRKDDPPVDVEGGDSKSDDVFDSVWE